MIKAIILKPINIIYIFLIVSCKNGEKHAAVVIDETVNAAVQAPEKGKLVSRTAAGGHSYVLYIPANAKENEKLPVIVFLDPHGQGSLPVEKYKSLADKFNFMLIGSNDSRNGIPFDQVMPIADDLCNEASGILPGRPGDISLAGFSGGAKAAIVCGNSIQGYSNIIYCGAALPPGSIEIKKMQIGFAGHKDMNYTEVVNFDLWAGHKVKLHGLVEWKGKHEWPDTVTFSRAFYWHLINSMKLNVVPKNPDLFKEYKTNLNKELSLEKNPLLKATLLVEGCVLLDSLIPTDDMIKKLSDVINSKSFLDAHSRQQIVLATEDKKKNEFLNSFESRDLNWWSGEISGLLADKNNESNQRLLGYISLASWSYSTKSIANNNLPFAKKVLLIYKLADPTNSERPFLQACLYSKNQMNDSALIFLKEAVALGLNDRGKIENEKNLDALKGTPEFSNIINNIK